MIFSTLHPKIQQHCITFSPVSFPRSHNLWRKLYDSSPIERRTDRDSSISTPRSIIIALNELTSKLVGWQASGNRCRRKPKPDDSCLIGRRETLRCSGSNNRLHNSVEWEICAVCLNGSEGFVPRGYRFAFAVIHRTGATRLLGKNRASRSWLTSPANDEHCSTISSTLFDAHWSK